MKRLKIGIITVLLLTWGWAALPVQAQPDLTTALVRFFDNIRAGFLTLPPKAADPTGVTQGSIYYNSSTGLRVYDGATWAAAGGGLTGISYDSGSSSLVTTAIQSWGAGPGDANLRFTLDQGNNLLTSGNASVIGFSSSFQGSTSTLRTNTDTGMARNAAGVVEFNNGTVGTYRDIKVRMFRVGQATPPTCSASCGTSPSVAGSDSAMIVTMGATGTPASPFTVSFNTTWAAAPSCIVQNALSTMVVGKMPIAVQTSTTAITITTNGTAPATSDKYQIQCIGVQ